MTKKQYYYRINWKINSKTTITYYAYGWIGTTDFIAETYKPIRHKHNGVVLPPKNTGICHDGYFPKKACTFRKLKNKPY